MQFVVHLSNKQRHLMNGKLIVQHVEYLRKLKKQEVLPFCGPCTDGTALMILQCDSLEEAKKLVDDDPFSEVGYYASINIVEIKEANEENNFHLDSVLEYLAQNSSA